MVVVIYATPDPVLAERLENEVLPKVDLALEKSHLEAYALINDDHINLILEPEDDEEEEAIIRFISNLEEDPDYDKIKDLLLISV